MPTTAYNRKYVYLSPERARATRECVEVCIKAHREELARLRGVTPPTMDCLRQVELVEERVRLLMDCSARLNEQATRHAKLRPPNPGQLVIGPTADDYADLADIVLVPTPKATGGQGGN